MTRNGFLTTWPVMLQALESRFAPSFYDNSHGTLFKLHQHSTVNDYLIEFERLANCIVGLALLFLLSCFISGLNPELCCQVQALQPISLLEAMPSLSFKKTSLTTAARDPVTYFPRLNLRSQHR